MNKILQREITTISTHFLAGISTHYPYTDVPAADKGEPLHADTKIGKVSLSMRQGNLLMNKGQNFFTN